MRPCSTTFIDHYTFTDQDVLLFDTNITEYAIGNSNFNDQIIVDICRKNKLKRVTDDGDFKSADISIVTANQRLLTRAY
jgi:hypothetical protein